MHLRLGAESRLRGGAVPVLVVAAALLSGCGSSSDAATATTQTTTSASTPEEAKVLDYMKQRFGGERWYPLVRSISVSGHSVTVETRLVNTKTPNWNKKQAEAMCKAFLGSPRIQSAIVLYDVTGGGNTANCHG